MQGRVALAAQGLGGRETAVEGDAGGRREGAAAACRLIGALGHPQLVGAGRGG